MPKHSINLEPFKQTHKQREANRVKVAAFLGSPKPYSPEQLRAGYKFACKVVRKLRKLPGYSCFEKDVVRIIQHQLSLELARGEKKLKAWEKYLEELDGVE